MAKPRKRPDGAASDRATADTSHQPPPVGTTGRDAGENQTYANRVAMRAYELYLSRGASDGRDFDDWLAAERDLTRPREDDRPD